MNRFLARTLSTLNILFALVIIVVGAMTGGAGGSAYYYYDGNFSIPGAIFGAIGGAVVAALICGTIAFLTLIERHLSILADAARRNQP